MSCKICDVPTDSFCSGCRENKYCSTACQRSDWEAHKTYCKSVVPTPLDIKGKIARKLVCATCEDKLNVSIEECLGCRSIQYCSQDCQKEHWKNGHMKECKKRGIYVFQQLEKSSSYFDLAQLYKFGTGVEKDNVKSFEFTKKAAMEGDAKAMNNVGMCYFEGDGVSKDNDEAMVWLRAAALSGDITGYHNLGMVFKEIAEKQISHALESENCIYMMGAVHNTLRRQFESFKMAAEGGLADSFHALSHMYKNGIGCEVDKEKAIYWETR